TRTRRPTAGSITSSLALSPAAFGSPVILAPLFFTCAWRVTPRRRHGSEWSSKWQQAIEFPAEEEIAMPKPLSIGVIGYGFMARAHSNAYIKVNHFFNLDHRPVLKAVCARSADKAKAFADQWGYESVETDWRKLIARKDIDAIDICVPNNLHAEIAIVA